MSEDEEGRAAPEVTSGVPGKRQIRRRVLLLGLLGAGLVWWLWAAPPAELEIAGPVVFAEMDAVLVRVQPLEDDFGRLLQRVGEELPGYDDVVAFADGTVLASAMDGWIWRIVPATGRAER